GTGGDGGHAAHRAARALPDPHHGRHRTGHHPRDARAAAPDHELARLRRTPRMERTTRRDGFTLIEIMAVVLIIGLLTTLVGIAIIPQIDKGRVTTARTQIKNLEAALETFRMDNAHFPSTEQGLQALIEAPPDVRNFQTGGYLREKRIPVDPWGNAY